MNKVKIIHLIWRDGDKTPSNFDIIEQPEKTANMLIKQHENSKYPAYVSINDAAKYGIKKTRNTKSKSKEQMEKERSEKANTENKKIEEASKTTLKSKEQMEKERSEKANK